MLQAVYLGIGRITDCVVEDILMKDSDYEEFGTWLKQRRLAPLHRIPYLIRWVEAFLRLSRMRNDKNWQDTLHVFLETESGQV
jgi:hypothetical protein